MLKLAIRHVLTEFSYQVSGPLKLRLLLGLCPFSVGLHDSLDIKSSFEEEDPAESSDSSLESESELMPANLFFQISSDFKSEEVYLPSATKAASILFWSILS